MKSPSGRMLEELFDLLRIPSISSGGGDPADLGAAAEWLRDKIVRSGGNAEVLSGFGNPLVVGDLRAKDSAAPTILIYGHYDVQSADPIDAWTTPPFEPDIRNGRVYARGASDDKGNFYPLLYAACELADNNLLPVNIRCLIEGEEESGGTGVQEWVAQDDVGADCAVVFDSDMRDERTPALTIGVRGCITGSIDVKCANQDLHSGTYGGAVLNALHVLHDMLDQVMPGPDGVLRDELRSGIIPPTSDELESWIGFAPGMDEIAGGGGRPIDHEAALRFYERTWGDASLDLNGIAGGDAVQKRTIIPAVAAAKFSIRLAPGQDVNEIGEVVESLLRSAVPSNADVEIEWDGVEATVFDPHHPVQQLGAEVLAEVSGVAPALQRVGGSIPVLKDLDDRGIPTILSGFALPEDAPHAVDESFRLESLALCEATAYRLYERFGELGPR